MEGSKTGFQLSEGWRGRNEMELGVEWFFFEATGAEDTEQNAKVLKRRRVVGLEETVSE